MTSQKMAAKENTILPDCKILTKLSNVKVILLALKILLSLQNSELVHIKYKNYT